MTLIIQFIIGLAILGILVFVHESGHFLVAKWRKVRVNAFSIGFGKVLFKKKIGETEYRFSALPFGGYVMMEGEDPSKATGAEDEFSSKKVWERIAIAFAGPFFNILFALVALIFAYSVIGVSEVPKGDLIIGYVTDSNLVNKVSVGDKILKYNNVKLSSWDRLVEEVAVTKADSASLTIKKTDGKISSNIRVKLFSDYDKRDNIEMRYIKLFPVSVVVIKAVYDSMPAYKAGIKAGDVVKKIDGNSIYTMKQLMDIMNRKKDSVSYTILRNGALKTIKILPDFRGERPLIGVVLQSSLTKKMKYGVVDAVIHSFEKSREITAMTFRVLVHLVKGHLKMSALSGPVGIAQITGSVATSSFSTIFYFIALISLNLALFNLLPLVITDGGLIMFFIIEIFRGKPLSLETQSKMQQIAFFFFLAFALFVSFFDVKRIAVRHEPKVSDSKNSVKALGRDSLKINGNIKDSIRLDSLKK